MAIRLPVRDVLFVEGVGATAGFTLLAGAGLGATGCAPQEDGANLAETGHTVVTPQGTYEVYETDMLVCGCGYAGMSRRRMPQRAA